MLYEVITVIPHQLEGSESAEVESQVELEEGEEFSCDAASVEGEIAGMTGDAVQEGIEGGVLACVSGGSGHGVVSCSRDGRWRDLKHTTLLWTKNDGETKSARFSDSQKLRKVRSVITSYSIHYTKLYESRTFCFSVVLSP